MEKIKTRTAEFWKDEHEIVCARVIENVEIDLEDLLDNILVLRQLANYRPALKLVENSGNWTMTKEARERLKLEDNPNHTIARAVVCGNLPESIIQNIIQYMKPAGIPVKTFSKREDAINWLLEFKK